ncbi:Uncharacterised protein [Mycobacteroides abscessus subsp. abscessus]|nr:Uncharacterised protein [Mycobacteroides abscessus subsp. abscessus]
MLAMWSRPTRIAARKVARRVGSPAPASSNAADAWVIVTSLRTPRVPMMNPASSRPLIEMLPW